MGIDKHIGQKQRRNFENERRPDPLSNAVGHAHGPRQRIAEIAVHNAGEPMPIGDIPGIVQAKLSPHPLDVFDANRLVGPRRFEHHQKRIARHEANQRVDQERDQQQREQPQHQPSDEVLIHGASQ